MIGKLSGRVDGFEEDGVIIDVGGVGYLVFASARTLGRLTVGESASVLIETHVREDHIHLYGFIDHGERDWFRLLLGVQGVGTRHAVAILSVLSPENLVQAVAAQDKTTLTRANGVGPKLAARIAAELKDKVANMALGQAAQLSPEAAAASGDGLGGQAEDAVSALVNLGYKRGEAFSAVAHAAQRLGEEAGVESLIREGLKELSA